MQIRRFCGKERLPGGARRWQRLARRAGFTGNLYVFGYGTGGVVGREQRRCYRDGMGGWTMGDFEPDRIRVWLACAGCAAVEHDPDLDLRLPHDDPMVVFAHELGHHVISMRPKHYGYSYTSSAAEEAVASRYGRSLLRKVL